MKKLFLTAILALFFAIAGMGQNQSQYYVPIADQVATINITINQIQNGWTRIGNTCAGCPSYWCQVTRTQQMHIAEDGNAYYYYFFHYFSNSFYGNGVAAGTYLSQVNFYHNGILAFNIPYILIPTGQHVDGAWIRSQNGNSTVTFTTDQISVY